MPDLEKVIKALECCDDRGSPDCEHCPYMDDDFVGTCRSRNPLFRDTLALLKPRLLTLDELHVDMPVFIEDRFRLLFKCWTVGIVTEDWVCFCGGISWPVNAYNRDWRCWSGRPTEEQRKAAKWD